MSNPDPASVLFSSRYKYFLNKDTQTGSVTLSATSIASLQSATFSLNIPIENVQDYSQIKINFSHDPNDWYIYPLAANVTLDANFFIDMTASYTGSSLALKFYVRNNTGSTHTSTATTATVKVYLFETPESS